MTPEPVARVVNYLLPTPHASSRLQRAACRIDDAVLGRRVKIGVHRLANKGKIPLELIEVQTGSYFGEDDIERLDDVYKRT